MSEYLQGVRVNIAAKLLPYGVELECFMPSDAAADVPNRDRHIPLGPRGWKGKTDGSLTSAPCYGMYGVEVVSPVIKGEAGLQEVWYMIDFLKALGGDVNAQCGLHIHYDARTLSFAEVDKIGAAFVKYEMAFFGLNGDSIGRRLQSTYCKHSLMWSRWGAEKRQSLNRQNYGGPHATGKSTLEFRLYENMLDAKMTVTAIYMGAALISRALADDTAIEEGRYGDPRSALEGFINAHYGDPRFLIIPTEEADDLISYADEKMLAAERFINRHRRVMA